MSQQYFFPFEKIYKSSSGPLKATVHVPQATVHSQSTKSKMKKQYILR